MMKFNHPYHLVTISPWPLMSSLSLMILMSSLISIFHKSNFLMSIMSLTLLLINLYQWWRDIIRESTIQGFHTMIVLKGLQNGMVMFILSEIMFFISFFWCYFHMYLSPSVDIGVLWNPINVTVFNPYNIPLLNTLILLSSGITITYCHNKMMNSDYGKSRCGMRMTIILGLIFSFFQVLEYNESFFSINDSVYGSVFFLLTGFHGFHVIIGTTFNMVMFFRFINKQMSSYHFFGFEAAAWYWHFVDLVWLYLFLFIYWLPY